jgi:sigma-B regulation protein RsbU (phosphoserine phosphatase)
MEIASNPALSFQKNSLFSTYIAKKKTDHEMSLARTVQRTLIPSGFPEVEAYRFAATYEPATQVGGDYYDWIMPDEHRICFIFGDVSGKGLSGALIMCRLAGAARALLGNEHDPARALGAINAHLCDRMPGGRFVTLALLALDLKTHQFTLANAGHLPPLYRGPDGAAAYVGHEAAGIPIGIEKDASYEEYAGVFEPDSALVFYTDGVSEAMGTGTTLYGMDRLRACVAAVDEPIDVGRALRDDVRRFGRGRPQSDDLTILTVARDGPGRQRGGVSPAHASSRAE